VAYHDEELLGTSALLLNELKSRPEYNIWVGGVLVKPEFRGNGIAKKLTEAAQVKAKELGYCKIFLKTEHAQGLYEKLGWKHFEKTVNDDGSSTDVYTKDL
jgi:GNAT superfamily N-acetyltransferase